MFEKAGFRSGAGGDAGRDLMKKLRWAAMRMKKMKSQPT